MHPGAPSILVGEDVLNRRCKPVDVTVRNRLATADAGDHFAAAAVVADHDRRAAVERFKRHQAEDLVAGWIDNDRCGGKRL